MNKNILTINFLDSAKVRKLLNMCPVLLEYTDERHVLVFRRLLEIALTQGRWTGVMSEVS